MVQLTGHSPQLIMDAAAIDRAMTRLAHEVCEKTHDLERVVLVGIRSRGVQVAERLQRELGKIAGTKPPLGTLDLNLRRDDVERESERLETGGAVVPTAVDGRVVILIDDVFFTGRTIRAAIDLITELGRPAMVQVAVLVDRGGREVPIKADFVGHNARVPRSGKVRVKLQEVDGVDEVVLAG